MKVIVVLASVVYAVLLVHGVPVTEVDPTEDSVTPDVNNSDKGIVDIIDGIVNLGQVPKCATGEGQSGYCTVGSCSNLGNRSAVGCPGKTSLIRCCPNDTAREIYPAPVQKCGIRPLRKGDLIVGGNEAIPHTWPWAIALYRVRGSRRFFQCGGSIISSRYVLTAAHCVFRSTETLTARDFVIKVGAHDLTNSGQFVELEDVSVHENYTPQYHNDDIALLRLKKPLDFSKTDEIGPVCLPRRGSTPGRRVGTTATMVGWGVHDQMDFSPSTTLYEVQVPISDQNQCRRTYSALLGTNYYFNWNNVICASTPEGGKDTCQGDSGGPMTIPSGDTYYQVGVVSFGYGCAQKGYPGVYTYVPNYLKWIGAHMKP